MNTQPLPLSIQLILWHKSKENTAIITIFRSEDNGYNNSSAATWQDLQTQPEK